MDEHMKRRLDKQRKLFSQLGITLDALTIHEKEFSMKLRGYDAEEVDTFLDSVIKDYERFYATIADLMDKWQEQQLEMRELKAETKTEVIQVPVSRGIDPKELEEVILRLETNVRQLKDKLPRVEEFL
ncbi:MULTISPECIES: DivIVA domain-containing protein [Paenibacillus]|jgi:DivIVA domain-containing protein|uniref:Cell division protein n=1 Tax=Paenibacillus odorifer TaxID=189426 RepID=A0A1R0XT88_9BACL|nr:MULTISPECIES: DivIVA domain-containing protein [Paenibacillus]AIQ74193.1 cell division protein [Paenibacillus odorifer]ETT48810.1 DivIVA domain-containing protein [Paenibacillus sp. FSL H8-237]MDH6427075.1 DivIVA domain-containing protein [Paenibacillus sp. PastH-4]MDH6443104.1 DivIVA domain-containing protein [Paenibacillus sp. PastF-4]MDH6526190.1 DivIVA domain-containing protein [Paenibacillus sp. PastH-3]